MPREFDFRFNPGWRNGLDSDVDDLLEEVGTRVRDNARSNARAIDEDDVEAIETSEVGSDSEGEFIDVGYDRHHPGFVLWWHEVGTSKYPPRPHLRPAAAKRVI